MFSAVPGPMSSSNRLVILQCFMLVFPKLQHVMSDFEIRNSEIFCKINLDPTVRIQDNNLDYKALDTNRRVQTGLTVSGQGQRAS